MPRGGPVWNAGAMRPRIRTATALGALVVLALSGCMKMDMDIELHADDTVSGTFIVGISNEFADLVGQSPDQMAEEMAAEMVDVDGTTVAPYADDDYIGTVTTFDAVPLAEWTASNADDESLRVVREGDEYVVSGVLDLTEAGGMEEFGLTIPLDIRIAVTFPGSVTEHNGTLTGTTVEWVPVAGERLVIDARGSAVAGGGAGFPWLILVAGLVAVAAVVAIVLVAARRRSTGDVVAAPAAAGYAPEGYAPEGHAAPEAPGAPPAYAAPPVTAPPVEPPPAAPVVPEPGVPPVAEPPAPTAYAAPPADPAPPVEPAPQADPAPQVDPAPQADPTPSVDPAPQPPEEPTA